MMFGSRWLPNTPTSTHESEMLMLAKGAISSLGMTSVAEDLGIPAEPLLARCDNSAVVIVGKTGVHKEASSLLDSVLGAERFARAGPHPFGTCVYRNQRGQLANESATRDGVCQGT